MSIYNKQITLIPVVGIGDWGLGIGDWGLGIGDWGLGPIPNPQSPIPNPQHQINFTLYSKIEYCFLLLYIDNKNNK